MTTPSHHFSKAAEYTCDTPFDHAVRFAVDKRDAALMPVLSATSHGVVTVTDSPEGDWEYVRDQVAAGLFGGVPGARQALRPAGRGEGRGRFR